MKQKSIELGAQNLFWPIFTRDDQLPIEKFI